MELFISQDGIYNLRWVCPVRLSEYRRVGGTT